jgi:Fungal chitosanase of glycosyl hydrolase group 75
MSRLLCSIKGIPIPQAEDLSIQFVGELCIDADGSPRAYGPNGLGLDHLANAGQSGNWWGIVTDSEGYPVLQGEKDPAPGYYISTTSLQDTRYEVADPRRYVDSEKVPYIVVPGPLARMATGIVLGCKAEILNMANGQRVSAVVADLGPATHLGEVSIAAAKALGINPDPKTGGSSVKDFRYTFWPGNPAVGFHLQPLA